MRYPIYDDEDFAAWVRRVRITSELSQQAVADRAKGAISKSYIGFVENRDKLGTDLSLKKLIAWANGLGIPINEFLSVLVQKESTVPKKPLVKAIRTGVEGEIRATKTRRRRAG